MITKVYYIENSSALDKAIDTITKRIPCFCEVENIEMNYSKVTICMRDNDAIFVERTLAPVV